MGKMSASRGFLLANALDAIALAGRRHGVTANALSRIQDINESFAAEILRALLCLGWVREDKDQGSLVYKLLMPHEIPEPGPKHNSMQGFVRVKTPLSRRDWRDELEEEMEREAEQNQEGS